MCGIFGTIRSITEDELRAYKALINHRGPDSSGETRIALDNQSELTLAHTRLAIQDLSAAGHQPMPSANGRWTVTFNGEIYNHHTMRKSLNCEFRGSSDTETLVETLANVGIEKTLAQLNGIFGFAAFDAESGMLYIARDHFGTKPVYYCHENGSLSFSSEIKPLQALRHQPPSIDREGLGLFLNLRYTPSNRTLLQGIQRIPPGHYLSYNTKTGQLDQHCYISATRNRFAGSFEEAVAAYHNVFQQSVTDQLLSDVPVGILLSGGIDSALVAAYAAETTKDLTAFTVGFGGMHDECEIEDAAETAEVLGLKHESVTVDPLKLVDCLSDIVQSVEEPLGTTSIMPMWYLTECAKRQSTVVLTGQGSDEPWGGYNRYKMELLLQKLPFLKSGLFSPARAFEGLFKSDSIRRGLASLGFSQTDQRFLSQYRLFSEKDALALAGIEGGADDNETLKSINYWLDWLNSSSPSISLPEQMMRIDTRMNLADDLLLYADKISMHYALEARVPMLDKNLVDFVESLPLGYKSNLKGGKLVHKALAERYLPAQIVHRKKKGFQVPFGDWSRKEWRDYVESALGQSNNKLFSVVDQQTVQSIWSEHASGALDRSRQIFSLLTLSLWCEHYL